MYLPLVIGYLSLNEEFSCNIIALPNLFISYSEENQIHELIRSLYAQLTNTAIKVSMAVSKETYSLVEGIANENNIVHLYITNETLKIVPNNYKIFIDKHIRELKRRLKLFERSNISDINDYNTLRESNKKLKPLARVIIIVDDIFQLVLGKHKSTGVRFLQLLIDGPTFGIHFIAASASSYRNLLKQLIYIHPALKATLEKNNISISIYSNHALGAELILTGEGLRFFKEKDQVDFKKLYS